MTTQTLRYHSGALTRAVVVAAVLVLSACAGSAQTVSVADQQVSNAFTKPQILSLKADANATAVPEEDTPTAANPKENADATTSQKENADTHVSPEGNTEPNVSTKPAELVIGTLGVTMPVVAVGLENDGAMEIPDDVMTAGHYNPDGLGVLPGRPGTAVFAAHVDSRRQGRGALYELSSVKLDDLIRVADHDGTTSMWRVTEVVSYRKEVLPLADLFTFAGPSRIAVITCGGEFDRAAGAYTHNVVVLAEPSDGAVS